MGQYDSLFDDYVPKPGKYDALFALPDYAKENQAGPVTAKSMSDTQAVLQAEANRDIDVTGTADSPAEQNKRDLSAGKPLSSLHTTPEEEAKEFAMFAAGGLAGDLVAPVIGKAIGSVANRARAIKAARMARSSPATALPVQAVPEYVGPEVTRQVANEYVGPEAERAMALRAAQPQRSAPLPAPDDLTVTQKISPSMGRLMAEGTKGGAVVEAAKLEKSLAGAKPGITFEHVPVRPTDPDFWTVSQNKKIPSGITHRVVAKIGDQPVGDIVLRNRNVNGATGPDDMFVHDVNVAPEFRRQGIASRLYAEAEQALGKKIQPSSFQTSEGEALWNTGSPADRARAIKASRTAAAPKKPTGITYRHEASDDPISDHVVIAMKDGKEVGHAEVAWSARGPEDYRPMPDGTAFVTSVNVSPELRRQGIATQLYAEAEKATGRRMVRGEGHQTVEGGKLWNSPAFAERAAKGGMSVDEAGIETVLDARTGRLLAEGSKGGAAVEAAKLEAGDYVYHVTQARNLPEMSKSGLRLGTKTSRGIGGEGYDRNGKAFVTDADGIGYWHGKSGDHAVDQFDGIAAANAVPVVTRIRKSSAGRLTPDDVANEESIHARASVLKKPIAPEHIEVYGPNGWEPVGAYGRPGSFPSRQAVDGDGYLLSDTDNPLFPRPKTP